MAEIIPAIIAKDFQELKNKIKKIKFYTNWAQLDIMDGKFVNNLSFNNSKELKNLNINIKLEAHLMIDKPENCLDNWIKSGVKRIIFHYESTDQHQEIIQKIKQSNLEVGIAINPETNIDVIDNFINNLDLVLIMTVHPGRGGQLFLEEILEKIRNLRAKYKNVNIEVDGGINLQTAPQAIQAGANLLAVGSAIFQGNIEENIKKLKLCH